VRKAHARAGLETVGLTARICHAAYNSQRNCFWGGAVVPRVAGRRDLS
jgi:hypothetical protein